MREHAVAILGFLLALVMIFLIFSILPTKPSSRRVNADSEHQPALVSHTNYTVQEIDGCEYILYRVYVDSSLRSYSKYECRLIHKENCKNHPPVQILHKGR